LGYGEVPCGLGHAALLSHRLQDVQIAQFDTAADAVEPVHGLFPKIDS